MSRVTVIGFGLDQSDKESESNFIRLIDDITIESLLAIATQTEKAPKARIITVRRLKSTDQRFGNSSYSSVYFLNEAAADMCADMGISLPVIGEAEHMPGESSYEIQAYYLPQKHR